MTGGRLYDSRRKRKETDRIRVSFNWGRIWSKGPEGQLQKKEKGEVAREQLGTIRLAWRAILSRRSPEHVEGAKAEALAKADFTFNLSNPIPT